MREVTGVDDLDVPAGRVGAVGVIGATHVDDVGVGEVEGVRRAARGASLQALARPRHAPDRVDGCLLLPRLEVLDRLLHARHARVEGRDVGTLQLEALVVPVEMLFGRGDFARELVQDHLVCRLRGSRGGQGPRCAGEALRGLAELTPGDPQVDLRVVQPDLGQEVVDDAVGEEPHECEARSDPAQLVAPRRRLCGLT